MDGLTSLRTAGPTLRAGDFGLNYVSNLWREVPADSLLRRYTVRVLRVANA